VVRKDAWNDFNFFEFTKASFMAQDVIYPGEGSMCTWEKGEIHCVGVKCSIDINWKWKHNNPKPVGHCKSSAKEKVHSNIGIPQETRKKWNKKPNSTPKATQKGRNEETQG